MRLAEFLLREPRTQASSRFPPFPLLLAALSGASLTLAFPEPSLAPIAWLALAPLLLLTRGYGLLRSGVLWLVFGLGFFGVLLVWISIVGYVGWALLVMLEATFVGLFGVVWAALSRRTNALWRAAAAAAAWVGLEYLRSRVPLGGFTWGQLAQSQHDVHFLLRAAQIGGGPLVTGLIVFANACLAEAWTARRAVSPRAMLPVAAAVIALAWPALLPAPNARGEMLRVAVVQGNVPRDFEGTPRDKELAIIESHVELTEALAGRDLDLVVWPESSVGLDPDRNPEVAAALTRAARAADADLIVGGNLDLPGDRYQVMAFHVDETGAIVERYQKTHLVPFGEYVPARAALDFIPMLEQVPRDAVAGREPVVFDVDGAPVATVVSFEGDFGSLVRGRIDHGGRLLVVATNTSTWNFSWASAQHVAFSQLRAAENGVWVVHAALSGISAFVTPEGEVLQETPLYQPATIVQDVRLAETPSFYARTGEWVPLTCIVFAAALLVLQRAPKRLPDD